MCVATLMFSSTEITHKSFISTRSLVTGKSCIHLVCNCVMPLFSVLSMDSFVLQSLKLSLVTDNGWGSKCILLHTSVKSSASPSAQALSEQVKGNHWVELLKFLQVLCYQHVPQSYSTIRNFLDACFSWCLFLTGVIFIHIAQWLHFRHPPAPAST